MKAIVKTKGNYRNLNGKELDIIEILGTRVSCNVFAEEFQKNITVDFHLNEIFKIK